MAKLSKGDLKKRGNFELFKSKIQNNHDFILDSNKKVVKLGYSNSKKDAEFKSAIASMKTPDELDLLKVGNGIVFPVKGGSTLTLGKLFKSPEFGGSDKTGTEKEDAELAQFNKELNRLKKETGMAEIPLKVEKGSKYVMVDKIVSTPGTPKSDFHAVNLKGEEVAWFSHKDGSMPKDFQQWGGMTEKGVVNTKPIQDFALTVQSLFPEGIPRKTTVARKLSENNSIEKKVMMMSMYGVEFGGKRSRQNVNVIIQGPITLAKSGKGFCIKSNHVHYNGEMVDGGFVPVLMAIYKGDRDNFGVKGARFAIQPLESRKIKQFV